MNDKAYCYPPTYNVLKNKLNIKNSQELESAERMLVVARAAQGVPEGQFDLAHLMAIHFHLFQDVYSWAGQIRTIEISKGGNQFQFQKYIETGMADIHARLSKSDFLCDLSKSNFALFAGEIIGDLNYVHPFREGNGRTQLQYLKQLATQAGHEIDLKMIQPQQWMNASKEAHVGNYHYMASCVATAIGHDPDHDENEHE